MPKTTPTIPNGLPSPPRDLENDAQVSDTHWRNPLWAPLGLKSDALAAQCAPQGAQTDPPGPPQASKQTPLKPRSLSRWPCGVPVGFFFVPLVRYFQSSWPLVPSIHQPVDLRPNNPSTPLRHRKGPAECAERLNPPPTASAVGT